MTELKSFADKFNKKYGDFLKKKSVGFSNLSKSEVVTLLMRQTEKIALLGGKRLRPYLVYLSFKSFGGKGESFWDFALGFEAFHLFALVHDDIIDQSGTRHFQKTLHVVGEEFLRKKGRNGDFKQISEGQAMLAGDLLLAWSLELASKNVSKPGMLAKESFWEMVDIIVSGEMLDVDISTRAKVSLEDISLKNEQKTARYSVEGPIKVGARLATGSKSHDRFAQRFGFAAGLAFQIQDDALDVRSSVAGKDGLVDVEAHQHTYVTFFMQHLAKPNVKKEFAKYFGKTLSYKEKSLVLDLISNSGALEYCDKESQRLYEMAEQEVKKSNMQESYKDKWVNLLGFLRNRSA